MAVASAGEPRFDPAAIVAAQPEWQRTGEVMVDLPATSLQVADLPPYARMLVVTYLRTLLNREPLKSGGWYEAHRLLFGSLILDLEATAIHDALDDTLTPPPLADLRDPGAVERERRFIRDMAQWAAGRRSQLDEENRDRIDTMLAESAEHHEASEAALNAAVTSAQAALAEQPNSTDQL